jgi:hypothetical protein
LFNDVIVVRRYYLALTSPSYLDGYRYVLDADPPAVFSRGNYDNTEHHKTAEQYKDANYT